VASISSLAPNISVSNKTLDRQHMTVLRLSTQTLNLAVVDGKDNFRKFNKHLYEFHLRVLDHFYTEEDFLLRHDYPDFEAHVAEHSQYVERLSSLFFDVSNGVIDRGGLQYCLSDWITNHLIESDMKYEALLRRR
jgi:hemerythrin